jgi:hypothetical protein
MNWKSNFFNTKMCFLFQLNIIWYSNSKEEFSEADLKKGTEELMSISTRILRKPHFQMHVRERSAIRAMCVLQKCTLHNYLGWAVLANRQWRGFMPPVRKHRRPLSKCAPQLCWKSKKALSSAPSPEEVSHYMVMKIPMKRIVLLSVLFPWERLRAAEGCQFSPLLLLFLLGTQRSIAARQPLRQN